jgi:hypothetical protein
LSLKFPSLFSFAENAQIYVKQIMEVEHLDSILQNQLQQTHFSNDDTEAWSFTWGTQTYSPKKLYTLAFSHIEVSLVFDGIWKSKCSPRLKFFAWLVAVDRLNTKDMLHWRNLNAAQDRVCVLCPT